MGVFVKPPSAAWLSDLLAEQARLCNDELKYSVPQGHWTLNYFKETSPLEKPIMFLKRIPGLNKSLLSGVPKLRPTSRINHKMALIWCEIFLKLR